MNRPTSTALLCGGTQEVLVNVPTKRILATQKFYPSNATLQLLKLQWALFRKWEDEYEGSERNSLPLPRCRDAFQLVYFTPEIRRVDNERVDGGT